VPGPRIRDISSSDAPSLHDTDAVGDARVRLRASRASLAVVLSNEERPIGLVSTGTLRELPSGVSVGEIVRDLPEPLELRGDVSAEVELDRVGRRLLGEPDLLGAVVDLGDGTWTALSRDEIATFLGSRTTVDRLEGAPIDVLVFECSTDKERKVVPYYDPRNPPLCSNGHPMKPIK
jgi:hypothetical protein